ncbi:MAG: MgtC/SapB family protein [Dethiobacteria bacterium]|jgi:putative Mg2+ transporter-C (MgtC) family protein|nr:MgtC/SapB family protein [Bacillota bacterium]
MDLAGMQVIVRLAAAAVLGGLVGLERERINRPAGFRTHILVCVGSALFMLVSIYGFGGGFADVSDGVELDPSRIAAGVVTGVGFLGAGTIMRQGNRVRGLTTAASLWVVSAIGLSVGAGFYLGAVVTTALILVSLLILGGVEKMFSGRSKRVRNLWIRAIDQPGLLGKIGAILGDLQVNIINVSLGGAEYLSIYKSDVISMDFLLKVPVNFKADALIDRLVALKGVLEFSLEGEEREDD